MNATPQTAARIAYATLLPLVRAHLWVPDGKAPLGWSDRREGSVLKRLLAHRSVSQLEVAILGLARLRDAGQVSWLKPGDKVTCRALYCSRSGVSQVFELATHCYWRERRKHAPQRMQLLGNILNEAMRKAGGAA